jgi:hypothetical protein
MLSTFRALLIQPGLSSTALLAPMLLPVVNSHWLSGLPPLSICGSSRWLLCNRLIVATHGSAAAKPWALELWFYGDWAWACMWVSNELAGCDLPRFTETTVIQRTSWTWDKDAGEDFDFQVEGCGGESAWQWRCMWLKYMLFICVVCRETCSPKVKVGFLAGGMWHFDCWMCWMCRS